MIQTRYSKQGRVNVKFQLPHINRITALERELSSLRIVLDGERKRSSDLAQIVMVTFYGDSFAHTL